MTMKAAAAHLPRFASESGPEFASAGFRRLNEKPAPLPAEERLSVQDAAVAEALATARAEFDAIRATDRDAFERRLAERETEILASVGETLSGQVTEGLAAIEERVGRQVGTVLLRFLDQAVHERAVSELIEAVSALVTGGSASRVRIAGPAALVERVEAAIAPMGVPVERGEGSTADVSVTIDDTVVETNIAAWMERLMAQVEATGNG
jgi:hypothetical protein